MFHLLEKIHLRHPTEIFESWEVPEAKPVIRSWDLSRVHCRFYLKMESHHPSFTLKLCSLAIPLERLDLGNETVHLKMVPEDGMKMAYFLRGKMIQKMGNFRDMTSNSRMAFWCNGSLFESKHWSNQTSWGGKLLWSFRHAFDSCPSHLVYFHKNSPEVEVGHREPGGWNE